MFLAYCELCCLKVSTCLRIVFYMFVYSNSGEREKLSTTSHILCVRQVANGKLMLKALQFPWKMPFQYFHFWLGENVFATCLEFSSYSVREVICVDDADVYPQNLRIY